MSIKYIVKSKEGWAVKNAKAERATKNFATQAEAINFAAGIKGTRVIMVHDHEGKFRELTGWDQVHASNNIFEPERNFETAVPIRKRIIKWLFILPYLISIAGGVVIGMWVGGLF